MTSRIGINTNLKRYSYTRVYVNVQGTCTELIKLKVNAIR